MSERKIDLSGLPKKKHGNKERIDWKNSIGCKCKFIYGDIEGEVEIIDYRSNGQLVDFKYEDSIYKRKTNEFMACGFGKILGKITGKFKINTGGVIKDERRDLIITYRKIKQDESGINRKWYKYSCKKCGYEGWIVESSLLSGIGCGCCCNSPRVIVPGINDIATTDPWMIEYLVDINDAYKYTSKSGKKIQVKCPDCGRVKDDEVFMYQLHSRHSIGCICGDGIKYPEKFMINILEQLSINFIWQASKTTFKWIGYKKYDFYIPSLNLIIEMDGGLGHGKGIHSKSNKTLEESLNIDNWKDEQARLHGIEVIRIDCNYDNDRFYYIKNSILNSNLINYLNFDNIDWIKADKHGVDNLIKKVCLYYEKHKNNMFLKDISNQLNMATKTLRSYLNIGNKFGWCNYNKKGVMMTVNKLKKPNNSKKVLCVELNEEFESASDCGRKLSNRFNKNFSQVNISSVCRGERNHHQGFTFKYV